jgi:RNA polymerase sigma-70 factor (ECF subfamily)
LPARGSRPARTAEGAQISTLDDAAFKAELVQLIPHLRAFAFSLAGRVRGEDVAQDAMVKAWKSRANYECGTNMKAWAFTILRNQFISEGRRAWRTMPLDPEIAENLLVANDDPHAGEELLDVRNAMMRLPDAQREVLILAGPAGLTYEEVAKICGCAIGTVKSRVSRARSSLTSLLASSERGQRRKTSVSSTTVFDEIMQSAADLKHRLMFA